MEGVYVQPAASNEPDDRKGTQQPSSETEEDLACTNMPVCPPHIYDYHLAYHPSYQVPVLFFRGRHTGNVTASSVLFATGT